MRIALRFAGVAVFALALVLLMKAGMHYELLPS